MLAPLLERQLWRFVVRAWNAVSVIRADCALGAFYDKDDADLG